MKQIVSHIKKHLWKYGIGMAALAVLVGVFIPFNASDIKPEGYYTEADVFFKNVDNEWYHTEFANQAIYYATRGKVAKDNNRRRYATIGWQITAEANGYSRVTNAKCEGQYLSKCKLVLDKHKSCKIIIIML